MQNTSQIYNSRNFSILLNNRPTGGSVASTTVEIFLYYLTHSWAQMTILSTTVEIFLYYLTISNIRYQSISTTVEIFLYYLTGTHQGIS